MGSLATASAHAQDGRSLASHQEAADIGRLYREHRGTVYRRALRLLGNPQDAEEATQEVFERVLRNEASYRGEGERSCWLRRITTHYCLNRIRDRRRRHELFQLHVVPELARSGAAASYDALTLHWLLARVDERQLLAAIHVYRDGYSYDEAAERLGVSRRSVGYLLTRLHAFCAEPDAPSSTGSRHAPLEARC